MSTSVKSAMVEEPGKELNLGRHFSGPNPGRIGQRSQAMEDTISTAGCKFLFSCFKQPGVRCILERDGSQVIIQHLKLIMRSASQPRPKEGLNARGQNRTNSALVMHTVGEECRKSVRQGRFSKPTVMPKERVFAVTDHDRSHRAISLEFIIHKGSKIRPRGVREN